MSRRLEDVVGHEAPRVLGALVRRYGSVPECEDAVQEALIAAMTQWPDQGTPADPRAWLLADARRRLIDHTRSSAARRNREMSQAADLQPPCRPFRHDPPRQR